VFQLLDFVPDVPVLQIFKLQPNSNTQFNMLGLWTNAQDCITTFL